MAPYDATTNPEGGAEWQYLGANVKFKDDGSDALAGTWIQDFGDVEVGFVGAVTEDLPVAGRRRRHRRHRGDRHRRRHQRGGRPTSRPRAPTSSCCSSTRAPAARRSPSATDPGTAFGEHRQRRQPRRRRDRLRSHPPGLQPLRPGAGMGDRGSRGDRASRRLGRPVRREPQPARLHGRQRHRRGPGEDPGRSSPFGAASRPRGDAATQAIVNDANAKAAVLGAQPLGKIEAGFSRAKFVDGAGEPRWRVHAGQPGRRGPALGDRTDGRTDRVHEPGWSARGHARHRHATTRAR